MRICIAVHFAPTAPFGLGLRRGSEFFAARSGRQRVPEAWLLAQPQRKSTALLRSPEVFHPATDAVEFPVLANPGGSGTTQEAVRQKNIVFP
jgi:hypothetical protein